jgi:2-hydroxycyclohexanecarboxyl-CoA dehydrogenase
MAKKTCFVPRAGSPEDVGAGVAYFASKEAEWVTGQVLPLNGGGVDSLTTFIFGLCVIFYQV